MVGGHGDHVVRSGDLTRHLLGIIPNMGATKSETIALSRVTAVALSATVHPSSRAEDTGNCRGGAMRWVGLLFVGVTAGALGQRGADC